jgi:hypothetical protein
MLIQREENCLTALYERATACLQRAAAMQKQFVYFVRKRSKTKQLHAPSINLSMARNAQKPIGDVLKLVRQWHISLIHHHKGRTRMNSTALNYSRITFYAVLISIVPICLQAMTAQAQVSPAAAPAAGMPLATMPKDMPNMPMDKGAMAIHQSMMSGMEEMKN